MVHSQLTVSEVPKNLAPFASKFMAVAARRGITLTPEGSLQVIGIVKDHSAKPANIMTLLEQGLSLDLIEAVYEVRDSAENGLSTKLLSEFAQWFEIGGAEELFAKVDEIVCHASDVVEALKIVRYKHYQSKALKHVLRTGREMEEKDVDVVILRITSGSEEFEGDSDPEGLFSDFLNREDS